MSKTERKNNINYKYIVRVIVLVLAGACVGMCLAMALLTSTVKKNLDELEQTQTTVDSETDTNGIQYEKGTEITDANEISKAQSKINEYVNTIRSSNTYAQVMTGDNSYNYYLYNSNGEIFSQDTSGLFTEVFLNNGKTLKYETESGTLSVGDDIDLASLIENAFNAVGKDNVGLYQNIITDQETGESFEQYTVTLNGEDAVKQLYSSLPDEFGDEMVSSMTESLPDWKPNFNLVIRMSDNLQDTYCFCVYTLNNQEYTNWIFQGFDYVEDWALSESWYSYNPDEDESGDTLYTILEDTSAQVNSIMYNYAVSKGWDVSEFEDTPDSEDTESVDVSEETDNSTNEASTETDSE